MNKKNAQDRIKTNRYKRKTSKKNTNNKYLDFFFLN